MQSTRPTSKYDQKIAHGHTVAQKEHNELTRLAVATVVIRSAGTYTKEHRTELLRKIIEALDEKADAVLLPAGFYLARARPASSLCDYAAEQVQRLLGHRHRTMTICLGIDGSHGSQLALAITQEGIQLTVPNILPDATGLVQKDGSVRYFGFKHHKIFLAVCNDIFVIKRWKNPGVDVVFNLVHQFRKRPERPSGDAYFAKNGFAGLSKQWHCPVFGAAVFFHRNIPPEWPSGVIWNQNNKDTRRWRYTDNPLTPALVISVPNDEGESAVVRVFTI